MVLLKFRKFRWKLERKKTHLNLIFVHWITATNGWSTVRLCIANAYNYESYKYDTIHDICNIFFVLETPESWGENHLGWNYLQNIVSILVGFMLIFFGMEMSLYIVRGFLLESHHIFVLFSVFLVWKYVWNKVMIFISLPFAKNCAKNWSRHTFTHCHLTFVHAVWWC